MRSGGKLSFIPHNFRDRRLVHHLLIGKFTMWLINGGVYKAIFVVIVLLGVMCASASGQARQPDPVGEIYGGIEVSPEGVSVIALRVTRKTNGEQPDVKLVYSNVIRLALWRRSDGEFTPEASALAAQAVSTALTRLRQQYRAQPDHIYLIGSGRLGSDHPADLIPAIRDSTGLTLTFLDDLDEVQLRIAGAVPKVGRDGSVVIDSRNTSMLLHVGGMVAQGGYELLKYSESSGPVVDYVAMSVPQGAVSYANEISQAVGRNSSLYTFLRQVKISGTISFRQALRKEVERKPGLAHRKHVFLTGDVVWAIMTLLYPQDRRPFVPITYGAITQFVEAIARSPQELVDRDLSFIRDKRLRKNVEQEFEAISSTYTPQQLIAGADILNAAAQELKWQEKKIMFARFGHLGCILSYVRLQAGK